MNNVMDRIRVTLDPQSAANALYEVLLQWKKTDDDLQSHALRHVRRRELLARREAYERVLCAFVGVNVGQVRPILRAHFEGDNNVS